MSQKIATPAVPVLARIEGETVEAMTVWLLRYFNQKGADFNYVRGTRIVKYAYRGHHKIESLLRGCDAEATKSGRSANRDMVNHVAPLAFNRDVQVFDLPVRRFSFGRRYSGFRVPFFFVESGIIKLFFLHPSKSIQLNDDQLGMIATVHKRYLLDTEFFGQPADLEYVEASAPKGAKMREIRRLDLSNLMLWSDERLSNRLAMISEALDAVEKSPDLKPRRRVKPAVIPDMPLFA